MSTGLKANPDGSAAIQVGGVDAITLTSGGVAGFVSNPALSAGTANGVVYLNGSKVATSGSGLVFDGTNMGLGVTPSAWGSGWKAFDINTVGAISATTGVLRLYANAYNDGSGNRYKTTAAASMYSQDAGAHQWFTAASGTAGNAITFTQAMTLDASGLLAIGRTTAYDSNALLTLEKSGVAASVVNSTTNTVTLVNVANGTSSVAYSGTATNHPYYFITNNSERARITSGGEVYIAGTTDQGAYNLQCNGTGVWGAGAYVNGSDERIKEDIAPITSGLDVVTKLNPVTYRYKEDWSKDQSTQTGFIAQELLVAMEGKNYVDGIVQQGGSEGYYSVAYQNIIPLLTKAIQELKAELDATKAEVAALKGTA